LPPPASASNSSGPLGRLSEYKGDQRFPQPSYQPPATAGQRKTVAGAITGAFSSAVDKTKDALTFEPKVIPAEDPLSLSNTPKEAGPTVYFASARLHESKGNFEKADELYRKALEGAPNDLEYLVHYARMHDRAGNLERAGEIYRQAIAAHPREAAAYNDLGLCYARQERWEESANTLEYAVRLRPDSALYRNNLATVLVEMGRHNEALSHLTAVHGEAVGNYNLAYLLHQRGENEQAIAHLHRALAVDPKLAPASALLAQLTPASSTVAAASVPYLPTQVVQETVHRMPPVTNEAPEPYAAAPLPQTAASVAGDDWGDAPTPDDLPQLLPPVQ